MTTLKFANTHSMVTFLSKPTESDGYEQIVDFLNAHSIRHALTINPTIYISCIEQFWSTVKAKTINGEVQLHALVDGKKIIITESTVRRDLQLEDAEGVDCLPNSTIFEQLTLMGSKTTAWNEFSSTMASAIICLATNQKFNFSKYIFESMIRNLDNLSGKFLMYPSSSHPFNSINAIKTCSKQTNNFQKDPPQVKTLTVNEIGTPKSKEPKQTLEDEFKDLHLKLPVLEVLAHAPIYNAILDKYVESLELESRKSPTAVLFDIDTRRISIFTVNTKEYPSDVLARSQG
ncbi:hypothetical protein Tco_0605588 [Tanacetum coccineum]